MHCLWAVTLRPRDLNSPVSSSGDLMTAGTLIANDCLLTHRIVEIWHRRTMRMHRGRARTGAPHGARCSLGLWQAEPVHPRPDAAASRSGARHVSTASEACGGSEREQFDVLVIGGGITGAGVALDAASRGLRTALVERHDFASGTSSKSSKMVHGGLGTCSSGTSGSSTRPCTSASSCSRTPPPGGAAAVPDPAVRARRGGQQGRGARLLHRPWIYDLTGGLRIGKRHRASGVPRRSPTCRRCARTGSWPAFIYYDARADDARLTLAVARTAALDHGAVMANYAEVTGLRPPTPRAT